MSIDAVALFKKLLYIEEQYVLNNISRNELYGYIESLHQDIASIKFNSKNKISASYTLAIILVLDRLEKSLKVEDFTIEELENDKNIFMGFYNSISELDYIYKEHQISNNIGIIDNPVPKKKTTRANYSKHIAKILKTWLFENRDNPYPTEKEKFMLSDKTGLDQTQINNWFINARRRILPGLKKKFNDTN